MPTDRDDTAKIDLLIRRATLQILKGIQISKGKEISKGIQISKCDRSRMQTSTCLFESKFARDSEQNWKGNVVN